jgi:hypothetical protein
MDGCTLSDWNNPKELLLSIAGICLITNNASSNTTNVNDF